MVILFAIAFNNCDNYYDYNLLGAYSKVVLFSIVRKYIINHFVIYV